MVAHFWDLGVHRHALRAIGSAATDRIDRARGRVQASKVTIVLQVVGLSLEAGIIPSCSRSDCMTI